MDICAQAARAARVVERTRFFVIVSRIFVYNLKKKRRLRWDPVAVACATVSVHGRVPGACLSTLECLPWPLPRKRVKAHVKTSARGMKLKARSLERDHGNCFTGARKF